MPDALDHFVVEQSASRAGESPSSARDPRTRERSPRSRGPRVTRESVWSSFVFGLVVGVPLVFVATGAVLVVRIVMQLPMTEDFLAEFPGEYAPLEVAQPGFPVWLQWQHFFSAFLMVLIVRTGLRARLGAKAEAFWAPRWKHAGQGKVSLNVWFHQALDVLWIANGVIYVVLLFATGHWARIVPTSWEFFPNVVSAGLQYASLDWPTHNSWMNYNSLQQLMYFITVFVASPLAIASGLRMSSFWPTNVKVLNRVAPLALARRVHFPVMLYFVLFTIVHVGLVFATGALRNLNHIYGGRDDTTWVGLSVFAISVGVIVVGWMLARPYLLVPIARLFGAVSSR